MKSLRRYLLACLLGLSFATPALWAQSDNLSPNYVDSLVPGYLQLQTALAGDDLAAAKKAAGTLHAAARQENEFEKFSSAVHEIITATDIKSARTHFATVSGEFITAIEHVGTTGKQPLYLAHCPMAFSGKGGDWVQSDENVLNPYYGSMMLRCGGVKKQLAGK